MSRFLVDTDVMIDFLRGVRPACDFMEGNMNQIGLSVITVAEIYAGVQGEKERQVIEGLLAAIPLFDTTSPIAKKAGFFVSKYGRSHAVEIPDALIAATATVHGFELKTLNTKHYPMFTGIIPAYKKK